jgi:hypothetical protein
MLAPLSFGAEPKSWPLQRLDQDMVNAAFQLVSTDVSTSRVSAIGPDSSESWQLSGPKRALWRAVKSAVRSFCLIELLYSILIHRHSHIFFQDQGDVAEFHV